MIRLMLACLLLAAGHAVAQDDAPEAAPPPLSGPEVTEQRIDGVESGFSAMTAPGRMAETIPASVFRRAVGELGGEQAPEGARLTNEQRQRLRAIEREHAQALQAFRRRHADEFRQLREALGPQLAERMDPQRARGDRRLRSDRPEGDRGAGARRRRPEGASDRPADEAMQEQGDRPLARQDLTEAQRAAIARLRELRAQAPGPEAVQTKVWAELTEPQRAYLQERIDEHRARMAERRQAAYVERMAAQRERSDGAPDVPEPDRPEAGLGAQVAPSLSPRRRETLESLPAPMRQRLEQLPPGRLERLLDRLSGLPAAERAQVLRRLQQARQRQGEGRRGDGSDRAAPPPIDRLKVPDPGDK